MVSTRSSANRQQCIEHRPRRRRNRNSHRRSSTEFEGFSSADTTIGNGNLLRLSAIISNTSLEEYSFNPGYHSTWNATAINQRLVQVSQVGDNGNNELSNDISVESDTNNNSQSDNSDPGVIEESDMSFSAPEPLPHLSEDPNAPITYQILPGMTQKGNDLLISSDGFEYVQKIDSRRVHIDFKCSVSSCGQKVKVKLRNGVYLDPIHKHTHAPKYKPEYMRTIRKKIKDYARMNPHKSCNAIANKLLANIPTNERPLHNPMNPRALTEQGNRAGRVHNVVNPENLDFELNMEFLDKNEDIPDNFFRGDIRVVRARHMMFASDAQLKLLKKAKILYFDATFKVAQKPFYQLLSVHVFIKSGEHIKQVPVAFFMMSRRRRIDYEAVIKKIFQLCDNMAVQQVVADFEAALWAAVKNVLIKTKKIKPKKLKGCLFHFNQSVFRKVTNLGLKPAYRADGGTKDLCRFLMCLPLIPAKHVKDEFEWITQFVHGSSNIPQCQKLVDYFKKTWMSENSLFQIDNWCWYLERIRSNNDVEGWHTRINTFAGNKIQFYPLLALLGVEAKSVEMNAYLVQDGRLRRKQSKKSREQQQQLFELWEAYKSKDISVRTLLYRIRDMFPPSETWESTADHENIDDGPEEDGF